MRKPSVTFIYASLAWLICLLPAMAGNSADLPRTTAWVILPNHLQARLCVQNTETAVDRCWEASVEVRNPTAAEIPVDMLMARVFQPLFVRPMSAAGFVFPSPLLPRRSEELDENKPYPQSDDTAESGYGCNPRLPPGRYRLRAQVLLGAYGNGLTDAATIVVNLPPLTVSVWRPLTASQLRQKVAAVWKSVGGDHAKAWPRLIALVKPEMRLADVQIILPGYTGLGAGWGSWGDGAFHQDDYPVDAHWYVTVTYDYSGIRRDKAGMPISDVNDDNRVLVLATLRRVETVPVYAKPHLKT